MLERICKICRIKFFRKKSQIIIGGGNYCSNKCRIIGRKNGKNVLCTFCGIEIYRPLRQLNKSKSGNHFCSKKCLFKWIYKKYDGHPNWKGGIYSYRDKLIKNSSKTRCILCEESDRRMLAVHHIDKNRKNNNLKNLAWLCHNCHFLVHNFHQEKNQFFEKIYDKEM